MVAREVREFIGIPRFPAVKIDLAIVVPKDVTAERVQQSIRSAGRKLLEGPRLFDVYRSKGAEAGTKDEGRSRQGARPRRQQIRLVARG